MPLKRKRQPKLVKWDWTNEHRTTSGNAFWESKCGRFKIVLNDRYYHIPMEKEYICWTLKYSKGLNEAYWFHLGDTRGKAGAVKLCEARRKQDNDMTFEDE